VKDWQNPKKEKTEELKEDDKTISDLAKLYNSPSTQTA
jgi:hypothetical protein